MKIAAARVIGHNDYRIPVCRKLFESDGLVLDVALHANAHMQPEAPLYKAFGPEMLQITHISRKPFYNHEGFEISCGHNLGHEHRPRKFNCSETTPKFRISFLS